MFSGLEELQLIADVDGEHVTLNTARNLITARSMSEFTTLRGIKVLQMIGKDHIRNAEGKLLKVSVNHPKAAGQIIARRIMELPPNFVFRKRAYLDY